MIKVFSKSLIVIISIFCINISLGQTPTNNKTYNQNDLERNKVYDEMYNFWKSKNNWFSSSTDTLSYFVDDRNYKGIINYGVSFRNRDYTTFYFFENLSMCFLKVEFIKCDYNSKDNLVNIEGFVSGEWYSGMNSIFGSKTAKVALDVFLGEKTDTIKACYLGDFNKDTLEIKLKGIKIDKFTVLDKFPAFYFKKYSHYKTADEGRRFFKISGKVTKNTLLVFGGLSFYADIFDVGAMIYDPNRNKNKKIVIKEKTDCKELIIKNKLKSDIVKEELQKKENDYYTYTESAEKYILLKQYAKAKEQYNLLNQNYSPLFARDIHNAITCAILSRDYKTAFLWGEKLASKGIELPYFNSKVFNGMRKNTEWKSFSIKYDSICRFTKSNWNLKLKKELTELVDEDQADYGLENRKNPKELNETTGIVTGKLIDLLKKEGYPSEEKIGSFVKNDTILILYPEYNVLIRHAVQQKPENLNTLNELLEKAERNIEYDGKRSFNNTIEYASCFHIYKGNLYVSKSCSTNEIMVKKITFKFNNPNNFILVGNDYIISEYDKANPEEFDKFYNDNFNFVIKLTDDWEFYEK